MMYVFPKSENFCINFEMLCYLMARKQLRNYTIKKTEFIICQKVTINNKSKILDNALLVNRCVSHTSTIHLGENGLNVT